MDQLSDDTWIHSLIFLDHLDFMTIQTVWQRFYKLAHSTILNSHWKFLALSIMRNWNNKQEKQNNNKNNKNLNLNRMFPLEKMSDYPSKNWHRIYYELIGFKRQSKGYARLGLFRSYPLVWNEFINVAKTTS